MGKGRIQKPLLGLVTFLEGAGVAHGLVQGVSRQYLGPLLKTEDLVAFRDHDKNRETLVKEPDKLIDALSNRVPPAVEQFGVAQQ